MFDDPVTWEGVAASFLEPIGVDEPLDPRLLCVPYELELVPMGERSGSSACTRGAYVKFPALALPQRQSGIVAHELGHVALRLAGEDWHDEQAASFVGAAILVPRRPLLRALRRHGANLDALRPIFEHASPELLARRVADVGEYACTVVYGGRHQRVKRHAPNAPWAPWAVAGPTLSDEEHALVEDARAHGAAEIHGARAWFIDWPGYPHVIVIDERIEALDLAL
jgi:hypothetical protein